MCTLYIPHALDPSHTCLIAFGVESTFPKGMCQIGSEQGIVYMMSWCNFGEELWGLSMMGFKVE